jgi:exopolysaccharide biosynthesis polyprenyl glycosylphosphotransferase
MPNGLVNELEKLKSPEAAQPNARDVRARKAPIRSIVIRWESMRRLVRIITLAALDAAGVFLAIWTAIELKAVVNHKSNLHLSFDQAMSVAPLGILVTLLLFARSDLYADRAVRPGFTRIVASMFQVTVVVLIYAVAEGEHFSSYYIFYGSLFFSLAYLSGFRWLFDRLSGWALRAAGYRRRAVIVGKGDQIDAVAHALGGGSDPPLDPVGFVSLTPRPENGMKNLGSLAQLERYFGDIDEVLIADPDFPQAQAVELVDLCHRHGVRVRVAPSTMEILMDRVEFIPGQTVPLFELKPPVFEGIDFVVKRSFDVVMAGLLVFFLSPLLLFAAVSVKLSSRGPVVYRSVRRGLGGAPFACFKFRTMYEDADARQEELEDANEKDGALFKMRDDPRVTPIGRFLRRWSIDELPQLLNVLRGEMSLVGPRPLPERDYQRLEDWHRKRYLVLPGMTGLWQVSGRSELDFDELVRLDFLYLERWSAFLDLSIMLKTIPAVLRARGAW